MQAAARSPIGVVIVVGLVSALLAGNAESQTLRAARLGGDASPPVIDGLVTDHAWSRTEAHSTFTQQDPNEGQPATERTEVRLLLSETTLYVGIVCFDREPDKIIVSQARRDSTLTDVDSVQLVLDTFNDSQNAFVFGTNALGIEYDGQVAGEGQTTGAAPTALGNMTTQRGTISGFNPNWDGDWSVKAQITERGWEAEMAIPLKTLRYAPGTDRTWGLNLMRVIRRKNEQVYLAPIPRGSDIYRVSLAAKVVGLSLAGRRDLKLIPYALGSASQDYVVAGQSFDRKGDAGIDVKWGVRPSLTADFTVNTDFAQVEADEEQLNLTRFDLFFPEKRSFFLENASTFQFGAAQQVDLFFSRRIGLTAAGRTGAPLRILGGARLSGKVGQWDVGLLDMQTQETFDGGGGLIAPGNNFGVVRIQREVGRSTYGGILVNRQGTGTAAGRDNYNRAYGLDANIQISNNAKFFAFIARSDTPGQMGSDYSGRLFYNFSNNLWQFNGGVSQVGDRFNPEVGFLPRRGYRRPEYRVFFTPQPKRWPWIRRIAPHANYNAYYGLDGALQSSHHHWHPFEIQPARGGRFGQAVERVTDRPTAPFVVFDAGGKKVVIPPGAYTWYQLVNEYYSDPSAVVSTNIRMRVGKLYDGDFTGWEINSAFRAGSRFTANIGWTRQNVELPYGAFHTDLVPVKISYSFTTLANIQALVQYNNQTSTLSSNIRLALLNRSGTGLFVVYNERRDTTDFDPHEILGRTFVIKYTRLFGF